MVYDNSRSNVQFLLFVIGKSNSFSNSLSEQHLHLRIIQLRMILESIFLKDNETTGMVNKCKNRFLKLMKKYDNRFITQISDILNNMYQISHKMSHKSVRIYIDNNELSCFQINLVELLTILSQNQIHAESKNDLIDFLEIHNDPQRFK